MDTQDILGLFALFCIFVGCFIRVFKDVGNHLK